jgi:hypothetical protein
VITTIKQAPASGPARQRLADRIGSRQRAISGRAHAAGDNFAREVGLAITCDTGRLGFGSRTYHDPRFDATCQAVTPAAMIGRTLRQLARAREAGQ